MKKIGIIGGAGPLAGALLLKSFIMECQRAELPVPEIHLINIPFTGGATTKSNELAETQLREGVEHLISCGVDIALVACNTLHLFLPKTTLPILSLPECVMEEAKRQSCTSLLILGTEKTCSSLLYHSGIKTVYLPEEDQMTLNRIIDRVLKGKLLKEDAITMEKTLERLSKTNFFDGIVLGCTDLPVLFDKFPIESKIPLYDSIKIPAQKLCVWLKNFS